MQPIGESADKLGFTFRFETPAVSAVRDADGNFEITLDGFATRERRSGAPDIPVKMVRVAIPEGVVPRLEIVSVQDTSRPGIRPRPVATEISDVFGERAGVQRRSFRERSPAHYDAARSTLDRIAWLGEIGTFRGQRYVEVHLAPVRYDPSVDGLRVATSFELSVRFDGDPMKRTPPRLDPTFESVYRNTFVNYGQGTTFRISHEDSGTAANVAAAFATVDASGPIQRIKIRQNGIVRLDVTRMNGTTGFLTANLSAWKLTNRGVEVPLEVKDVNLNNLMDSGDWVQFYGQALDDEPKAVLNTDIAGTPADLFEARDFTDENTYFLSVLAGTRSRMATLPSAPTMIRTPPNDFQAKAHAEVDSSNGFRPLGGADPWYWAPGQANPAQGGETATRTVVVNLPGLASGTLPAHVLVRLRAGTEDSSTYPDHHSQVILKDNQGSGNPLKSDNDNQTWDGRTLYTHDFSWTYPGSGFILTNPAQVTLQALPVSASVNYVNEFILDWIEIQYRALFQASGDVLTFDHPDGDAEFIVSGLSGSAAEVWEITGRVPDSDVVRAVRLTSPTISGVGPYSVRFRVDNDPALPDGTPRRFVVFGPGGVSTPANPDFQSDTVSDLRQNAIQADLIVIAHSTVLGALSTTTLNQLLSYRATKGITSKIAMMGDVEDEFNDGLPGPLAIENFLRWVTSTAPAEGWADPKPAYVLLLGDGSYDYKGGVAQGNFIPTQIMFRDDPQLGFYASDNVMTAVIGTDQLADLVVGRIPVRTDAEANTVLQKILSYEQAAPVGSWRRHAIFIADRGKRDASGTIDQGEVENFQGIGDAAESSMKRPPHTDRKLYYYSTYCTHPVPPNPEVCNPSAITADIKSAVNGTDGFSDGAAVVQTAAHGNYDVWSDDAFWDDRAVNPFPDTSDLTNGGRLPWLIAHGCLTGGFHTTASTMLGEDWIKKSGGGAVAVFAPSDLTFTYLGFTVAGSIFNDLYGPPKERTVAVPVMDAISTLCGQGSTEACQGYILMGDPATDLVLPAVGPAQNVVATGGNMRVDLTWGASTTAGARYDIYRSADFVHEPLAKINASPVTGLTYADTGLLNARTYNYAVVAFDASGFESRWSHFNSDCAVSGPDCLEATPLNPNPPAAPTGFAVTDPESGGKLNLAWSANTESDLGYYEVHYGTAQGVYTAVNNAGRATSFSLVGLVNGTTYYIAITATNTSGRTSANSQETTGTPTWVRGVRSPQFIANLRLRKSGTDIVVSWDPVATTIYGKATTIARYEIYRGTTVSFDPGPSNLISPPGLTGTSFTDPGALSAGTNTYYLVRALDSQGNGSGLGNQLPMGIDALAAAKSTVTPGNIVLSWPAVTTEFSPGTTPGRPLRIDRYEVYARSTLFTRGDIRDGLVPLETATTGASIELTPPASTLYYSVLAVDARGNKSPF